MDARWLCRYCESYLAVNVIPLAVDNCSDEGDIPSQPSSWKSEWSSWRQGDGNNREDVDNTLEHPGLCRNGATITWSRVIAMDTGLRLSPCMKSWLRPEFVDNGLNLRTIQCSPMESVGLLSGAAYSLLTATYSSCSSANAIYHVNISDTLANHSGKIHTYLYT